MAMQEFSIIVATTNITDRDPDNHIKNLSYEDTSIASSVLAEYYKTQNYNYSFHHIYAIMSKNPSFGYYDNDGTLLGWVSILDHDYVTMLYVIPLYRKSDIGALLLQHAVQYSQRQGYVPWCAINVKKPNHVLKMAQALEGRHIGNIKHMTVDGNGKPDITKLCLGIVSKL